MINFASILNNALALAAKEPDYLNAYVNVEYSNHSNLRWATSKLTTNGTGPSQYMKITAFVTSPKGTKCANIYFPAAAITPTQLKARVREAFKKARTSQPDQYVNTFCDNYVSDIFEEFAEANDPTVFTHLIAQLATLFKDESMLQYGYAEFTTNFSWFASGNGMRYFRKNSGGRVEMTARSQDGARSAWQGVSTKDIANLSLGTLVTNLKTQLEWQQTQIEVKPGKYTVVLPSGAVGDLILALSYELAADPAFDGTSPLSCGKGTSKLGQKLSSLPINIFSDPSFPGLDCEDVVINDDSDPDTSAYDTGIKLDRTDWIKGGTLNALISSRKGAAEHNIAFTPDVANFIAELPGATANLAELIAGVKDGILLNTLWYIRMLDAPTLLQTGLTRDGVFVIKDGKVIGATTNFRFNESPLSMLSRIQEVGATQVTQTREAADWSPDISMPPMVISEFNFSSVSLSN